MPRTTAASSATASPSQGLLGVLPVPAGATAWPSNHNTLLNLVTFVELSYSESDRTTEKALDTRRGFVSAVQEGWMNADGSQQVIRLVRFATPTGATSDLDAVISGWQQEQKTMLTDPATGAVGWSSPVLDSQGDANAEFGVTVGDTMILAVEYSAATPDPAAARALLRRQYDRLKNGS